MLHTTALGTVSARGRLETSLPAPASALSLSLLLLLVSDSKGSGREVDTLPPAVLTRKTKSDMEGDVRCSAM